MLRYTRTHIAVQCSILIFYSQIAFADPLDRIGANSELVVGVKVDYEPYGFINKEGAIVGLEPDLAADLADRLGLKLRLKPVTSANRIEMLQQGQVDLILATMNITEERRAMVSFISPAYYASGIAALAASKERIKSEADLRNRPVCAIKGNFFNKELQSFYVQRELIIVDNVLEAKRTLLSGRCTVFVFDDTLLLSMKKYEAKLWKDYDLVEFEECEPLLWGIAVKLADADSSYSKAVGAAIVEWHTSGVLAEIEKKWLDRNSPWVIGTHNRYKERR